MVMVTDPPPRGEFELIAEVMAPLARTRPGAFGLTDDAAVLGTRPGHKIVVTTDAMIAGVHFAVDDPPDLIARKLLRVNLSDLAAMGASATGYLLVVNLDEAGRGGWIDDFARGLALDQETFGVGLLGGDSTAGGGALSVSMTAVGEVREEALLRRTGARLGDDVYVSGTLGDAALGLGIVQGEIAAPDPAVTEWLVARLRLPSPRLDLGRRLGHLASAAIDISDGLIADLGHICACSGVAAEVDFGRIPLSQAARGLMAEAAGARDRVLGGGEDYELVFTVPPSNAPAVDALADELELPLTPIGRMAAGAGVRLHDSDGTTIEVASAGYVHF